MKWQLALAQHPMYLLIREDTQCAERTPPWGAPTIEAYIDRVRQNLQALERYPQLKLGYEWSGVELELLAADAPEMIEQMRGYAAAGRLSFYNGTYAQPHLQILSSEASLRQFQFGRQVYHDLGLPPVTVYAHQEASLHDQTPQLLRAFGYAFAAVPGFLTTLSWLEGGEMVLHGVRGPRFLDGDEFAAWEGLDGCRIPLFLHQPIPREMTLKETLAREVILGRLSAPPLFVDLPDMIAVDDAWMEERSPVEFARLDEVLPERYRRHPAQSRARLHTNWSYLEGIRAEELSRRNEEAEESVLQAEAFNVLAYALVGRKPDNTDEIWKTILKTQHHDVYCFSAPELRDKSIGWLQEAARQADALSEQAARLILPHIHTQAQGEQSQGEPHVVFHSLPHPQTAWVELATSVEHPAVFDAHGDPVPCDASPAEGGVSRVRFLAGMPGLGYAVFHVRPGDHEPVQEQAVSSEVVFETPFYKAVLQPDGTFTSLTVQPTGQELIDSRRGAGNVLSATDSTEISLRDAPPERRLERYLSDPPERGPQLAWKPTGPARLRRTALGLEFAVSGRLGERTQAELTIQMVYRLPRIDLTWQFDFDQASLGTFFDDDSKLLVRWPVAVEGTIHHDIPFGVVEEHAERPFFPTRWVDISDGEHGLAFFHRGTPNHWVSEGTLFNLIAWGEDTNAIHNGLGRYEWPKAFDQRLRGRHTIRQAVFPHTGDWRSADLTRAARDVHTTLPAFLETPHSGDLPPSLTVLALTDPEVAATSVQTIDSRVICRVYAAYGREARVRAAAYGLREAGLRLISGEMVTEPRPATLQAYQIGELLLETTK